MWRGRTPLGLAVVLLAVAACRTSPRGLVSGSVSDLTAPPPPPPPAAPAPGPATWPPSLRAPAPPPPCAPVVLPCCPDPLRVPDPIREFRNAHVGFSGSLLPNGGLAVELGAVWRRAATTTWSWEVQGTWQFLDDKTLVDDGNPEAGDWYQLQVGIKASSHPQSRRHWTGRAGLVWFRAEGTPNIVELEGDYYGAYASVGFEVDLTDCLTIGPALTGMVVFGPGDPQVVPQLNWHVIWTF